MRTEAECIADGIREYVAKLDGLLELARIEELRVYVRINNVDMERALDTISVVSIERTEIL